MYLLSKSGPSGLKTKRDIDQKPICGRGQKVPQCPENPKNTLFFCSEAIFYLTKRVELDEMYLLSKSGPSGLKTKRDIGQKPIREKKKKVPQCPKITKNTLFFCSEAIFSMVDRKLSSSRFFWYQNEPNRSINKRDIGKT